MDGSVSSVAWPENHELPPFCGAVCSTNAEILVIGVAHRDEGVSGRAARKLIEKFEPDFCLVELDRQRFSRLVAARRNLPWVYAPVRGAQFRPAPIVATLRETVFSVLGFASRIVGLEDEGGGDEFFAAFEAAEQHGAFVIPGDVAVSQAIDSLVTSIRRGLADPVGHIISGTATLLRANGGTLWRPDILDIADTRSWGIAVPLALASEGGGRLLPLVRSSLVGLLVAGTLSILLGIFKTTEEELIPSLDLFSADGFASIIGLLVFILLGGLIVSAFALSFLRGRDEHMVNELWTALETAHLLSQNEQCVEEEDIACKPLWCRWGKKSYVAFAPSPSDDGKQEVDTSKYNSSAINSFISQPGAHSHGPMRVPMRSRPSSVPREWPGPSCGNTELSGHDAWLPLFTLRRPLEEGQVRRLSLFEPRFLSLIDDLASAGVAHPGLRLAVVHARHGSERPSNLQQDNSGAGPQPPLAVDVDAILEGHGQVVEVVRIQEGKGEDNQRRWRLEVKATANTFCLREVELASDELGVLWAAPHSSSAPNTTGGHLLTTCTNRPIRCVAVVGLLHVNGMVQGLRTKFAAMK